MAILGPLANQQVMSGAVLEAVQLCRSVGPRSVPKPLLRDVSLQLERGTVLAVLGPSGSGKSTLLRMLNRLDEPTDGQLLLDGQDYREINPRNLRRRVGMVMQRPYLFPGTAAANVSYGPLQHGNALSSQQIADLIEQVGMTGHAEDDVSTLSGGEAQRISIARALANEPEVLLLDEPTSALDEVSRLAIERLLFTLVRNRNTTCVWVTHDVAQASRIADIALKIESGRAVAYGTVQEILRA